MVHVRSFGFGRIPDDGRCRMFFFNDDPSSETRIFNDCSIACIEDRIDTTISEGQRTFVNALCVAYGIQFLCSIEAVNVNLTYIGNIEIGVQGLIDVEGFVIGVLHRKHQVKFLPESDLKFRGKAMGEFCHLSVCGWFVYEFKNCMGIGTFNQFPRCISEESVVLCFGSGCSQGSCCNTKPWCTNRNPSPCGRRCPRQRTFGEPEDRLGARRLPCKDLGT